MSGNFYRVRLQFRRPLRGRPGRPRRDHRL